MSSPVQFLSKFSFLCALLCAATLAQEPAPKPSDPAKPTDTAAASKSEEKPSLPFQIQLLETHIRFESNGDSRKEVHTIVKINDPAGARQFSRLGFDYNRAFQQVEIPLVKVTHANGGTSEILPSAITDVPNPAVQEYPAYHDVRVKSVRIFGLQDGDTIEYRVITTTTKHPLAPHFWLEHIFDRSGQVLSEDYELDIPATRAITIRISPGTPARSIDSTGEGELKRTVYQWHLAAAKQIENASALSGEPDLAVTTFTSWTELATQLDMQAKPLKASAGLVEEKTSELANSTSAGRPRMAAYYHFVRTQIKTIDVPLDSLAFKFRDPSDVLSSGYGTVLEKFALLHRMAATSVGDLRQVLVDDREKPTLKLPIPTHLVKMVAAIGITPPVMPDGHGGGIACGDCEAEIWLDIGSDVAPFGVIRAGIRGKMGLLIGRVTGVWNEKTVDCWRQIPDRLPFQAKQSLDVTASISPAGDLHAKVNYRMRGDNELLLREAFHQTPKERWKEVAGLLALSDGFRGTITNVTASDPMETKDPFTLEYEITQAKFVDWSKRPVHIPALLPQIAMPDAPGKTAEKIELGTPLDVETSLNLQLPTGTTVQTPAATSVARDYVTFASKYAGHLNTLTASRSIYFLKREIPADRAADYNAFLRAVQNDQAQMLVLLPPPAATSTTP